MKYSTKKTNSMPNNWLIFQLAVVALFSATSALAEIAQSPLFLTTAVKPNIMLMVDDSGSMATALPIAVQGYDPTITYLADTNCASNPLPNKRNGTTRTYGTSIPTKFFGYVKDGVTGTQCFSATVSYTTSLSVPANVITTAQRAYYLNWYYQNEVTMAQGSASTRLAVAKTAAKTLVDSLDSDVRLGLSTLTANNGGALLEAVDDLTLAKKTAIKTKIDALSAETWTPLAETLSDIGRYFATGYAGDLKLHPDATSPTNQSVVSTFNNRTIVNSTGVGTLPSPVQYSCQKNFAILVTDGQPTMDRSISTFLNDYDGDCANNADGHCKSPCSDEGTTTHYDMKAAYPYMSCSMEPSDYLDDVAKALYEIDLRPDITKTGNEKNNVTTYTIGFADDAINPNLPGVNPLLKNTAEKGGGKFYFAGSASELSGSLQSAFEFIAEQASSSSSVATNSTQFQTDTLLYQAIFDSSDWSGDLLAYGLTTEDTNGNGVLDPAETTDTNSNGQLDPAEDVNGNGKIDAGSIGAKLWSASALMPAAANRHIYSYDPLATTTKGIEFKWTNLNTNQQAILGIEPVLDYLRGVQAKEQSEPNGTYRNRSSILGDIVNSDPLFVGHDNYGYATLPEGAVTGSKYVDFIATSRREMLYVAANDGMLHGFDASTGTDGGKEIFAYLPNAAITPTLVTLTDPNYMHRYIVDGAPQTGDVYFNGTWHTVLVGGLGAGGKALFALDITDPDAFLNPADGIGKVLWEFTDTDLGYTLPQASIVRTAATAANDQWAAIVANGYNSASGKAVLYIINIGTGAIIKQIEAGSASVGNGLSSPVTVDVDNDNIADYVYAGDLKGNMWKFDISSNDINNWRVAYNGAALFVAMDTANPAATQAITSKPTASKATGAGQTSGTMLYFGTGKYFETGDNVVPGSPQIQSFYAIWDVCGKTSATNCNGVVSGRTFLQQQSITHEGSSGTTILKDAATTSGDVRITSNCQVAYGNTAPTTTTSPCTTNINRRGWYLDLLSPPPANFGAQGERVVSTPVVRHGVVIFPTLIPITTTCTPGGTSWLMELDQFSGAPLSGGTPIDLNNDGLVDELDWVLIGTETFTASGFKSTVGIIDTPAIINCEDGMDCKYASGSSAQLMSKKERAPKKPPNLTPVIGHRTTWRQIY